MKDNKLHYDANLGLYTLNGVAIKPTDKIFFKIRESDGEIFNYYTSIVRGDNCWIIKAVGDFESLENIPASWKI